MMPQKLYFPTADLRQTVDAVISLLNNTLDADGNKVKMPAYVTTEYVTELVGTIILGLINVQKSEDTRKVFDQLSGGGTKQ